MRTHLVYRRVSDRDSGDRASLLSDELLQSCSSAQIFGKVSLVKIAI